MEWTRTDEGSFGEAKSPPPSDDPAADDTFTDFGDGWTDPAANWSEPERLRVALLGPPGCGKTSFAASIRQACLHAIDWPRSCLPLGDTVRLVETAATNPGGDQRLGSADVAIHRYHLESEAGVSLALELMEVPGDRFMSWGGETISGDVVAACRWADALVLLTRVTEPVPDRWRIFVERVIETLAAPYEIPVGRRRWPFGSGVGDDRFVEMRCMHFSRVLLLVTCADLVAHRLDEFGGSSERNGDGVREWSRRLDPSLQLVQNLGWGAMSSLRRALDPEALFAGGIISALAGTALAGSSGALGVEDGPDRWRPIGVLDSLRFLIEGQCSTLVRALARRDLVPPRLVPWQLAARRRPR